MRPGEATEKSRQRKPLARDAKWPNRYAGKCCICEGWVEAKIGLRAQGSSGTWYTAHTDCANKRAKARAIRSFLDAIPTPVEPLKGVKGVGDDDVQRQRTGAPVRAGRSHTREIGSLS